MTENAARRSRPETIDFILSCSICQDTLSTVYAQHENKEGLHQGTDNTNGAITKLWLTECAHVTCAKHLEGGGKSVITFHSDPLLTRLEAFPSTPKTSHRRHHAHSVSATNKITRTRYSMPLEVLARASTTTTYLRSISKSLLHNLVNRAMKHYGYSSSPDDNPTTGKLTKR